MPRSSRLVPGLLAAAVLATAGCTLPVIAPGGAGAPGGASTGHSRPGVPGTLADWQPCPEEPRKLVGRGAATMSYDCASVAVPRDWSAPQAGGTYAVQMIRIRSRTQTQRLGSLVINPGGPGGSGVDTAIYLSYGPQLGGLPTEITDRFDLVGFDPRGVSRSDAIKCISTQDEDLSFALDPDPVNPAAYRQLVALNQRIGAACGKKYGAALASYSTEQAARDMDAIRAAVGDKKLTYLGFSYGTLLGATYAQLFANHVRALVLDGAVDPTQDYVTAAETQAKGFERAFTDFAAWCRRTPAQCPIGPDARKAVTAALAAARTAPVAYSDGRKATAGWIFVGVISSLYTQSGWKELATALQSLQAGNAKAIFALADQYAERRTDGSYSNLFDANLAVNCADAASVPGANTIRTLQASWRKKYPLFGAPLAVQMLPCTYWPGRKDPYPTGAAKGAPPIVVVGTTGDPATPYENTADLARMLGVGHVLTWEGEGHTAYPSTPCIVGAVDRYLIDLAVPQQGLRCPAK